jgi:deoxyribodipyrimidine photo-lyase
VDELRREAKVVNMGVEKGIAVDILPDTCVVAPGELHTSQGKQFSIYSPFYRAWMAYLHSNPIHLKLFDAPAKNPEKTRKTYKSLFDQNIPEAPPNKQLTKEEKVRFENMWPAGEHEARRRLEKFLKDGIGHYQDMRNFPASNSTSILSPHFAAGTLSARTAVSAAQDANSTRKLDGGNAGIRVWISEVAWRDFYKHVLAHWPFIWYVPTPIQSSTPLTFLV